SRREPILTKTGDKASPLALIQQRQGVGLLRLDPQGQLSFGQTRLQLLAGPGVLLAADGMALLIQQDAVAASEGSQRADQVQPLSGAFEQLATLLQLPVHGPGQA